MISRDEAEALDGTDEPTEALLAVWDAAEAPNVEFVDPPADLGHAVAEELSSLDDDQLRALAAAVTDEEARRTRW